MPESSVISLPIPLILLVHLYILEYPHANQSEYDHNLFEPRVHGLRERTKLMEDICHFLVGRVEGKRSAVKSILLTYPCIQPSDTVAFRTSLAKYLETLRHNSIFSQSKLAIESGGKAKAVTSVGSDPQRTAWWWKDVIVRKSLLEECVGIKFERLLLSFSTHALFIGCPASGPSTPESTSHLLHSQPAVYSRLLSEYQLIRLSWSRLASELLRRRENLNNLRMLITSPDRAIISKYSSLSTDRLLALAESRNHDLLKSSWNCQDGLRAFRFIIDLAGIGQYKHTSSPTKMDVQSESWTSQIVPPPPPLPIAAAHHPSFLKKLRRPVFQSVNSKSINPSTNFHSSSALSNLIDLEKRANGTLNSVLSRLRMKGDALKARLTKQQGRLRDDSNFNSKRVLNLWHPSSESHQITFDNKPTPDLLATFSLGSSGIEESLESRIDRIRDSLLPNSPPSISRNTRIIDLEPSESTNIRKPPRIPQTQTVHSHIPRSHLTAPSVKNNSISSVAKSIFDPVQNNTKLSRPYSKKSIRKSLAVARQSSMHIFNSKVQPDDPIEDEVSKILDETQDTSDDSFSFACTPKPKNKIVNRIYTAGTPRPKSTIKKISYPLALPEPSVSLPSLATRSSSFGRLTQDGNFTDDESEFEDDAKTTPSRRQQEGTNKDSGDEYLPEAHSMTLRDLLLQSESMQFDLLDETESQESIDIDSSFEWE